MVKRSAHGVTWESPEQKKDTHNWVNFFGAELGVCALRKQQQFVVFSKQTGVPQHDLGIP